MISNVLRWLSEQLLPPPADRLRAVLHRQAVSSSRQTRPHLTNLALFHPPQTSFALSSIAKLGYYNAEIVGKLLERSRYQMAFFQPSEAAAIVWALAKLGVTPGARPGRAEPPLLNALRCARNPSRTPICYAGWLLRSRNFVSCGSPMYDIRGAAG